MKNNAQNAYNKLASIQQYLLWFAELDFSENAKFSIEDQQKAQTECYDIVKAAKQATLKESGPRVSLTEAWDYSDKWKEISERDRVTLAKVREALRPILGYV